MMNIKKILNYFKGISGKVTNKHDVNILSPDDADVIILYANDYTHYNFEYARYMSSIIIAVSVYITKDDTRMNYDEFIRILNTFNIKHILTEYNNITYVFMNVSINDLNGLIQYATNENLLIDNEDHNNIFINKICHAVTTLPSEGFIEDERFEYEHSLFNNYNNDRHPISYRDVYTSTNRDIGRGLFVMEIYNTIDIIEKYLLLEDIKTPVFKIDQLMSLSDSISVIKEDYDDELLSIIMKYKHCAVSMNDNIVVKLNARDLLQVLSELYNKEGVEQELNFIEGHKNSNIHSTIYDNELNLVNDSLALFLITLDTKSEEDYYEDIDEVIS